MSVVHWPISADDESLLLKEMADELLSGRADDDRLKAAAAGTTDPKPCIGAGPG